MEETNKELPCFDCMGDCNPWDKPECCQWCGANGNDGNCEFCEYRWKES